MWWDLRCDWWTIHDNAWYGIVLNTYVQVTGLVHTALADTFMLWPKTSRIIRMYIHKIRNTLTYSGRNWMGHTSATVQPWPLCPWCWEWHRRVLQLKRQSGEGILKMQLYIGMDFILHSLVTSLPNQIFWIASLSFHHLPTPHTPTPPHISWTSSQSSSPYIAL